MGSELQEVSEHVAQANRVLAHTGLASGVLASLGHCSMRLPSQPDRFVVKGRGYELDALAAMKGDDMVLCDLEGYKMDGPLGSGQCYEVKMHSAIYKTHPNVKSVVHVHPRFTIIMGLQEGDPKPMCNEGAGLVEKPLPMFPHQRLILTEEDGMAVAETLGDGKAVLLRGHGAATAGNSVEDSVVTMLQLEEQAKMNWYAVSAVGPNYGHIPDENRADYARNSALMRELDHLKGPMQQGRAHASQQESIYGAYVYLMGEQLV
jgi:ribulose-5-phosphate 4-epimerase/fuculose-1-phosphate aldolase